MQSTRCNVVVQPARVELPITPERLVPGTMYEVVSSDLALFNEGDLVLAVEYPRDEPLAKESEVGMIGWYDVCGLLPFSKSSSIHGSVYRSVHVGERLILKLATAGSRVELDVRKY